MSERRSISTHLSAAILNLTEEEILNYIFEKKTSRSDFAGSCATRAILGSASPEKIDALSQFGKNIGMALSDHR